MVDGRNIYPPAHGSKAERNLYEKVADFHGWVRGDYTLTEYLNDVTKENVEVLAEYGRNYCSVTFYTYGNERISSTTFNGYGYHFGCRHNGYQSIFHQYEKWHDRWQIKDRYHNSNDKFNNGLFRPRTAEEGVATAAFAGYDFFKAVYGSYSNYNSGRHCGHNWVTSMSKVYYLYDGHGSVERVHGKDGSTFRFKYDTYGNLVAGILERWHVWHNDIFAQRSANLYGYSGERYNVVSGLQFLRARWYDTDTGRFISEDSYLGTQAEPLSRNRYIYTHNNPVNYVDPSGHAIDYLKEYIQTAILVSMAEFCTEPSWDNVKAVASNYMYAWMYECCRPLQDLYSLIPQVEYAENPYLKELHERMKTEYKVDISFDASDINYPQLGLGLGMVLVGVSGLVASGAGISSTGGVGAVVLEQVLASSASIAGTGILEIYYAWIQGFTVTFYATSGGGTSGSENKIESKKESNGNSTKHGSKRLEERGFTEEKYLTL